jgi:N6-L-threonylcarbamoyladenine synthase
MKGHICANYLNDRETEPPFLCLLVSGGHTELVMVHSYTEYEALATTRDDSVGEAFDKVARIIGLGYPGGPKIDKLAKEGNDRAFVFPKTNFKDSLDFSFSGLKTAVINKVHHMEQRSEPIEARDIAASFQRAAVEALCGHTEEAVLKYAPRKLVLAGGVAANSRLRQELSRLGEEQGVQVRYPAPILCTDNAAMIGSAAYYRYIKGTAADLTLNAKPNLTIGENV